MEWNCSTHFPASKTKDLAVTQQRARSLADSLSVAKLPPRVLEVEDNGAELEKVARHKGRFGGALFQSQVQSFTIEWPLREGGLVFLALTNWEVERQEEDEEDEVSVRHLLLPMQIKALIKTKTLCADNQFIDAQVVLHCHFMEGNGERYVLLR